MEPSRAKKLWEMVRLMLYILRKSMIVSKPKLVTDLHLLLKRGKIAAKSLANLLNPTPSHQSIHHRTPNSPKINSTTTPDHHYYQQAFFQFLSDHHEISSGFGESPAMARQVVSVTDSPEGGGDGRVDREAGEFIKRFYEQLRLQQQIIGATPDQYQYRRGRN